MSISAIYRVSVRVPDLVSEFIVQTGRESEYDSAINRAIMGCTHHETDRISQVIETCEFLTLAEAQAADAALKRVIDSYTRLAVQANCHH